MVIKLTEHIWFEMKRTCPADPPSNKELFKNMLHHTWESLESIYNNLVESMPGGLVLLLLPKEGLPNTEQNFMNTGMDKCTNNAGKTLNYII